MPAHSDRSGVLFLGCGWATSIHSRTLRRLGGVELHYASRVGPRAEAYRRRFGGRRAFGSYDAGLRDPAVEVVVVATPTATHLALTLQALRAGKHVIVEKPAFMGAAEVELVRAEAARAGRRVLVAENYVYKPVAEQLRHLVGTGSLGDVHFVHLDATRRAPTAGWRADPALAGGDALFEAGVHWISFAAHLGLDVASVDAHPVGGAGGATSSSLIVFRYAQGAVGTLAFSRALAAPLRGLRLSRVQGTRGAVTFESNGLAAYTSGPRRALRLPALHDPLGYGAMMADFLTALRTGAPAQFTLEMAQQDLRWLEEVVRLVGRQLSALGPRPSAVP